MDEHVPRAITTGLRSRGVDVLTAQEDGRRNTPDPELLNRATELGRVIFSQDSDLLIKARQRQLPHQPFSGVIDGHQQRVTIGACVKDLELIAKAAEPHDFAGIVLHLPL